MMAKIAINGINISSGIIIRPGERIYLERYLDEDRSFIFETYDVEGTEVNKQAILNNGDISISFYGEKISTPWTPLTNPYNYPYCNIDSGYNNYNNYNIGTSNFGSSVSNLLTGQISKGSKTGQELKELNMDFDDTIINTVHYKILPESKQPYTKSRLDKLKGKFEKTKEGLDTKVYDFMDEIKEQIDKLKDEFKSKSKSTNDINDLYVSLNQLKELRDNGLITDKEFEKKRHSLVNG